MLDHWTVTDCWSTAAEGKQTANRVAHCTENRIFSVKLQMLYSDVHIYKEIT